MRTGPDVVLGGRYRLVSAIAVGGMGQVWQALDQLLGRVVAVKVLKPELASDPGFLDRFRTEARNSAGLAHPAIATVYDYGEEDGSAYLVMELVPGEPLSDLLGREGALDAPRAAALVAAAAHGLAAAHQAGIVHRDVKPGNLLVTPDGHVKITDFGIARAAAAAPVTATGEVMGTAAYFAPEQALGRRDITPAADLYALGIVLYEALAGRRPFTGDTQVAIALAQVNEPPPPLPPEVPHAARALVEALLVKEPTRRLGDATAVARVAERVAAGDDGGALGLLAAQAPGGEAPTAVGGPVGAAATAAGATAVAGSLPADATAVFAGAQPLRGLGVADRDDVLPGAGGGRHRPDAGEPRMRGGRALTVPAIGLLLVVAALLVVALATGLLGDRTEGPTAPATPTTTAPTTPSATSEDDGPPPTSDAPEPPAETSGPAPTGSATEPAPQSPSSTTAPPPTSTPGTSAPTEGEVEPPASTPSAAAAPPGDDPSESTTPSSSTAPTTGAPTGAPTGGGAPAGAAVVTAASSGAGGAALGTVDLARTQEGTR